MNTSVEEKLKSILEYKFFGSIGEPISGEDVTIVPDWVSAANELKKIKWENCRLKARNALQRTVEERNWQRSEDWNPLAQELQRLVLGFTTAIVQKLSLPKALTQKLTATLSWDIIGICFEHEYRDLASPMFYIPILEPWYAAGHFPCGWDGEEFPDGWDGVIRNGRLIVF
jgi:hypothetical protein